MIQSIYEANRIIRRWEDSLPVDNAPLCSCCGNPVDELYYISDRVFCEDCAKEMHEEWVLDDPVECVCCEEEITDVYYNVNGDAYCERCFEKQFKD